MLNKPRTARLEGAYGTTPLIKVTFGTEAVFSVRASTFRTSIAHLTDIRAHATDAAYQAPIDKGSALRMGRDLFLNKPPSVKSRVKSST